MVSSYKKVKKCALLGFVFVLTCSFISVNQMHQTPQYSLGAPSMNEWVEEFNPFIRTFIHQAKFIQLVNPHSMSEKEVIRIFSEKMNGASSYPLKKLAQHFLKLCRQYQFDPRLILSLIFVESGFNPHALSPVGARGLMQIMPDTAHFVSQLYGYSYKNENELNNPFVSLTFGISYLNYLKEKFDDHLLLTLMAYNMGPYHAKIVALSESNPSLNEASLQGQLSDFNSDYYQSIMKALENFKIENE